MHANVIASSMFALMITSANGASAASAEDRQSLQNLPVIDGSETCRWDGIGENSVCRRVHPTRLTAALEYPLLMRSQGWREVRPGHGAPRGEEDGVSHGDVLWFERPIDATCSERATMQLFPPPPPSERRPSSPQSYVVLMQSDYVPVCDAERQAQ